MRLDVVRGPALPRNASPRCAPARRGERRALALPPRSLLVLGGEARLAWHHYIPQRKTDPAPGGIRAPRAARRVSLTFRQARARAVRTGAMTCAEARRPVVRHRHARS